MLGTAWQRSREQWLSRCIPWRDGESAQEPGMCSLASVGFTGTTVHPEEDMCISREVPEWF